MRPIILILVSMHLTCDIYALYLDCDSPPLSYCGVFVVQQEVVHRQQRQGAGFDEIDRGRVGFLVRDEDLSNVCKFQLMFFVVGLTVMLRYE